MHIFPKIIMEIVNKNFISFAFEIMTLLLKSLNNGKEFCIVSFIILFSRNHLLRIEIYKRPMPFFVLLRKYPINSIF